MALPHRVRSSPPAGAGSPRRRVSGRILAATVITALATALATVLFAGTAAAHTHLESSEPAAGSSVHTAPDVVRLIFSDPVQSEGVRVVVTSPDGNRISSGDPSVADAVVTQSLPSSLVEGRYTVAYRVVSVDGHPVSDKFSFTYAPPVETSSAPSVESSPAASLETSTAGPTPAVPTTPAAANVSDQEAASSGSTLTWWLLAALGAVVIAVGTLAVVRLRQQRG